MHLRTQLGGLALFRIQDDRLHQHRGILEAIRDGAAELAKLRMTELLSDSINDVRQYLKQRDTGL